MSYLGPQPYPLNIPPGANIPVTAFDAATQTKVNNAVQRPGDTMSGALAVNNYGVDGYAQIRLIDPGKTYGALLRNDGTTFYVLLTNSGDPNGSWTAARPFAVNLANGYVSFGTSCSYSNDVWLNGSGALSTYLHLNANGYAPFIRSNSTSGGAIEMVNSANTAVNLTLSDAGALGLRAGLTATSGNFSGQLTGVGATFNGGVACNAGLVLYNAGSITLEGQGNTYSATLRGDSSGLVGFINNAGNAWNLQIQDAGHIQARGNVMGGSGSSTMGTDGNINGSIWSGWISNYLNGKFATFMTRNTANAFTVGWDGGASNINFSVDGTFIGWIHQGTSDIRLKTNIKDYNPDSLALVKQIQFHSFDFIANGLHVEMGVISQELQTITPRWVYQAPTPEATEDNPEPATPPLGVDRDAMLFDALQAIRQLEARIAVLEAR